MGRVCNCFIWGAFVGDTLIYGSDLNGVAVVSMGWQWSQWGGSGLTGVAMVSMGCQWSQWPYTGHPLPAEQGHARP